MEIPFTIFSTGVKNWFKIWHIRVCSFWGKGCTPWNFATWRAIKTTWSLMYKFWRFAPQKFWRAKKSKIRPDFGQLFTLTVNILRTDRDIRNRKQILSTSFSVGFSRKSSWSLVHKQKSYKFYPHQVDSARSVYANALKFGPREFATGEFQPPKFFPQLDLRRRVDSHFALPEMFSFIYGALKKRSYKGLFSKHFNDYFHQHCSQDRRVIPLTFDLTLFKIPT